MREVMAGSVLLPTMDFVADPVSGFMKEQVRLTWCGPTLWTAPWWLAVVLPERLPVWG